MKWSRISRVLALAGCGSLLVGFPGCLVPAALMVAPTAGRVLVDVILDALLSTAR
jgi:hypothetical protein